MFVQGKSHTGITAMGIFLFFGATMASLAGVTLILRRKVQIVRLGRAVRVPEDEILRLVREGTVPAKDSKRG
jgi:hypothetical protein